MAVVTTNLGVVTAYGDAVEGGYTGTKEQWQALMADYGTIGTQAQQDAQTASTAAQTATTKASEASASATQAQQAAASVSTPDTTLTQSGKAADAKATGDEISAIKENLRDISTVDVKAPSLLFDDWVLGTLGATGIILEYSSRITTEKYHRYDTVTTIVDKNTQKHMTLCLYNDDYSLNSRTVISTATATVPSNTLFRLTVWLDSTDISDISAISDNVIFFHESTMSVPNTALSALGKSKMLLPSAYNQGNLGTSGAYDATYVQEPRIVFYQYMKYNKPIVLNIDFQYTAIICLYTSSLALISRTSYMGKNKPQVVIPANTYFRVLVYKWDARGTDMTRYAEAVYISTIMSNIPDFIRIFESFAVIGDSLSCGYVGSSTGTIGSNDAREAGRNWPTYLGLDIGRTFTNLARGSSSAHDWRYGNSSLDVDIATADIDTYCYMVAVGVNDSRQSLTVGTSEDIKTDRDNNADTFYGNYDFIIRQLIVYKTARLSQAKIFVFTMPPSETNAEAYNDAIRYVASLYTDVTCVDLYSLFYEEWTSYPFTATWVMGHSRPFGYAMMADMIRKGVNLAMVGNVNQFLFTPWAPV